MRILSAGIVREMIFDDETEKAKYVGELKKSGKEYKILSADVCTLQFKGDDKKYPYLLYMKQDGGYELCQEIQEREG